MSKTPAKQSIEKQPETKALTKPTPPEEIKKILKEQAQMNCDPRYLLRQAGKTYGEIMAAPKYDKKLSEKFQKEAETALPIVALDTHYFVAEIVSERYRPFVITLAQQLIDEYQCQTASEKAIAQNIAATYGRILELSKSVMNSTRLEYLSHERTAFYGMQSKELDRAQRQFASSLMVLKQMKSPTLEVNIKAKTAFISQNQQINANTQQHPTSPDSPSFNV